MTNMFLGVTISVDYKANIHELLISTTVRVPSDLLMFHNNLGENVTNTLRIMSSYQKKIFLNFF